MRLPLASSRSHVTSHNHAGDENGYESSLDHDDDLSSDDDADAHRGDSDVRRNRYSLGDIFRLYGVNVVYYRLRRRIYNLFIVKLSN